MSARNRLMRLGGLDALLGLQRCDDICTENAMLVNATTPCALSHDRIACSDPFWCTTTCALWQTNTKADIISVSCDMFKRSEAYPWRATLCHPRCLLPEIRADRYPNPTGKGFFCKPGTCEPAAQSRHVHDAPGLGILECPCNWFGADCQDDWVPVRAVRKAYLGDMQSVVLSVDESRWRFLLADFQPGSVIRVHHLDSKGVPREQPYALLRGTQREGARTGEIEILIGPPPSGVFEEVVEVAHRVYDLANGSLGQGNLFVTPAISGFFNKRYQLLSEVVKPPSSVEHLVVVASGVGLTGALSAVQWALNEPSVNVEIHVYYGIRNIQHLPFRHMLADLAARREIKLNYIVSGNGSLAGMGPEVIAAAHRGHVAKNRAALAKLDDHASSLLTESGNKTYVQHAVGYDLLSGSLKEAGISLYNSAFVVCGRIELLQDAEKMVRMGCGTEDTCDSLVQDRLFTNI
eukprot:TRINITY_DN25100_c0_g1_i1.p1 TRINITY_DN25100_c0_g1~~TRINITY_DN25100_c0_g1_i1.p1  ORF type:complete len:530 (+),score=30.71 TRINITY_DN25100_c0_g1_i1:204-1592(+)